jgi:hypothetical protein
LGVDSHWEAHQHERIFLAPFIEQEETEETENDGSFSLCYLCLLLFNYFGCGRTAALRR